MSTKAYKTLEGRSNEFREHNDCTVKAWAVVAGLSYADAHRALANQGRRNRGRCYMRGMLPALCAEQGLQAIEESRFSSRTVRTLIRELPTRGRFLVFVRGHVLAVQAGKVHDWSAGRLNRVQVIYRITTVNQ